MNEEVKKLYVLAYRDKLDLHGMENRCLNNMFVHRSIVSDQAFVVVDGYSFSPAPPTEDLDYKALKIIIQYRNE